MTNVPEKNPLRPLVFVEDDHDDRELIELLVRKSGVPHPIQKFGCGADFMQHLKTLLRKSAAILPLVIFLDLALPDMAGLDLLQWIRSEPACDAISVVVLAGSENPEDIKRASHRGAQCFLAKYPQPSVFRRVVSEAMEVAAHRPARHWFGLPENLILRWGPSAPPAAANTA